MKEPSKLIIIYLLLSNFFIYATEKETSRWNKVKPPIYSNISSLTLFDDSSGVAAGRQLLLLKNGKWEIMKPQPPDVPILVSAQNLSSIYVVTKTEFHESEIFYWDGKTWELIPHPIVNNALAIEFNDKNYGIISGLGEIAILQSGKWSNLITPTNSAYIIKKNYNRNSVWAIAISEGLYKFNGKWKMIENSENIRTFEFYKDDVFVLFNNVLGKINNDKIIILKKDERLNNILSFFVLNENHIYLVGKNGLILHYIDDELNAIESNVKTNLKSIQMIDENKGWIGGDDGTILHFSKNINDEDFEEEWKGFEKVTFYGTSKIIDDGYGVVAADFNKDNKTDIFVCGLYESNHLFINKGNYEFVDEAQYNGVSGNVLSDLKKKEYNLGTCAADFDNDGNIDIYISALSSKNTLFHNIGDAKFVDYTDIANCGGLVSDRTNSVITGDLNNDGSLELFLCNENSTNRLYLNNGSGIFTEITEKANLISKYGGTGAAFADIDMDGDLDLFVANWSAQNRVYLNLFMESGKLKFIDFTEDSKISNEVHTKSNGVVFADIDNDLDMDLFVTNRKTTNRLYLNNGNGTFEDVTNIYLGFDNYKSYGAVIKDFDNDGYKDIYIANIGKNIFLKNIDGKKFLEQTELSNAAISGYSTGVSAVDLNNDFQYDLYIANYLGANSYVLNNKSYEKKKSILLKLEGIKNNRLAIGAKIFARSANDTGKWTFYTEVSGGSGYGSMNDVEQIVPCNKFEPIDIKVVFPDGKIIIKKNIQLGSILELKDSYGFSSNIILLKNYLFRLFFDWHRFFNLLKIMFVLLILFSVTFIGRKRYGWALKTIIPLILSVLFAYFLLQNIYEYKNFFLSTVIPLVSSIAVLITFLSISESKKLKQETEIEKEKLRNKLSRDLHDELASTISTATIYLELLKKSFQNETSNTSTFIKKIDVLLNNAKQNITDLIWTIKPKPEVITSFAARIRENYNLIFKEKNIQYFVKEINLDNNIKLNPIEKHNVHLIIKESINNILKHSKSKNVKIEIEKMKRNLHFRIIDDGIGFDIDKINNDGNGLNNLNKRADEIEAEISISSKLEAGTKIELIIKMT